MDLDDKVDLTLRADPGAVSGSDLVTKLTWSTATGNYKACQASSLPESPSWKTDTVIETLNPTVGLSKSKSNVSVVVSAQNSDEFSVRCQEQDDSWTEWISTTVYKTDLVWNPVSIGSVCLPRNATSINISYSTLGSNFTECTASSTPNITDWSGSMPSVSSGDGIVRKTVNVTLDQLPATLSLSCKDTHNNIITIKKIITGQCTPTVTLSPVGLDPGNQCLQPSQRTVSLVWTNGLSQSLLENCVASNDATPSIFHWNGPKDSPHPSTQNSFTQAGIPFKAPKTEYRISCRDQLSNETITAKTEIGLCIPFSLDITATPSTLIGPGTTTLKWNNEGADYCEVTSAPTSVYRNVDQTSTIGSNTINGVVVNQTTYFRLYCAQGGQSLQKTALVCVGNDPNCGRLSMCEAYPNLPFCKKKVPVFEER